MARSLSLSVLLIVTLAGSAVRAPAQQPAAPAPPQIVVAGTVYDTVSSRPLRLAVVRIIESGASTLTDDAGRYRLLTATNGSSALR